MLIHTPVVTSLSPAMLTVAIAAMLALLRFRLSVIPTILGCCALGMAMHLSGFALTLAGERMPEPIRDRPWLRKRQLALRGCGSQRYFTVQSIRARRSR